MAWINPFLLGRPGYEYTFDVNPEAMQIDEQPLQVLQRNLTGDMKKSVLRSSVPIIRLNSSYLTLDDRNRFASLVMVTDTFLSFQCRDDWRVVDEYNIPISTTQVVVQKNSATRLSQVLVGLGFSGIITVESVLRVPGAQAGVGFGSGGFGGGGWAGPDYFGTGTYNDATRTITLQNALPNATDPVYVTYRYKGWLVNIEKFSHSVKGGWIDRFNYDFQLSAA